MRFRTSEWIWTRENYGADEYAEFKMYFDYTCGDKAEIAIASDSNYALFINGKLAAFGQYADYPDYKVYDELNVSEHCVSGKNEVIILVWYYGVNTQNYIVDSAGVIFEISVNDNVVETSGIHTQSRLCVNYENGYKKMITSQLGLSFKYYGNRKNDLIYTPSVIIQKSRNLFPRPNEKLIIKDRIKNKVKEEEYGYQIDMGEETVGFLDIDIDSCGEQNIKFAYGQFLDNGRVKSHINSMDFTVEYVTHNDRNVYMNPFRRLSGRYLEILCKNPIKINYVGIRPVVYPLKAKKPKFHSDLRNKIYNTSVKTLICCMHEHYEDTPWREQALYTMDSRNEMLCTYKAFNDYKFARSNLVLISKGLRKDGMLSICYPAGRDIPIPSFSLAYILELYEYVFNSKDYTILNETFEVARKLILSFIERIDESGLIANFSYPFWNFYEWSPGSDNGDQISRKPDDFYPEQRDLILNCYFLFVLPFFKKMCEIRNVNFSFNEEPMRKGIINKFYDKEKKLYKANDRKDSVFYTELGNALAILCGLAGEETAEKMLNDKEIIPITLSMNTYVYEALLKVGGQKYKEFILNDIDKKYGRMLKLGATTFWETEKGAAALEHTGSLCHGWSAMPIYYYELLNEKKYFDGKL